MYQEKSVTELVNWGFSEVEAVAAKWGARSHSIFYSNPWLTLKSGKTYIVGTNPGGGDDIPSQTEAALKRYGPVAARIQLGLERALDHLEQAPGGRGRLPPRPPGLIDLLADEVRKALKA